MDVMRRFGGGELSEILGEALLKLDREQRILGLRAAAAKSLQTASPRDRSFFEAYARGVNAYIAAQRPQLPIEFRILRYAPKPWQAEDSVVIANQMVKDLNYHYFYDALAREKILAKLGPELTADLYVNRSWHDRPPTVMREDLNEPDNNVPTIPTMTMTTMIRRTTRSREEQLRPIALHQKALAGEWIERLGHLRRAHGDRQAAALERYAPRPSDAESLVRSAPATRARSMLLASRCPACPM